MDADSIEYAIFARRLAVFVLTGYMMIGFDRRKQGLHDKIVRTYVVRTKAPWKSEKE